MRRSSSRAVSPTTRVLCTPGLLLALRAGSAAAAGPSCAACQTRNVWQFLTNDVVATSVVSLLRDRSQRADRVYWGEPFEPPQQKEERRNRARPQKPYQGQKRTAPGPTLPRSGSVEPSSCFSSSRSSGWSFSGKADNLTLARQFNLSIQSYFVMWSVILRCIVCDSRPEQGRQTKNLQVNSSCVRHL